MPSTMNDHVEDRVEGGVPGRVRLADMQAECWGVTFSTWPTGGVLNGAPVDLRALERAAAVVRPKLTILTLFPYMGKLTLLISLVMFSQLCTLWGN